MYVCIKGEKRERTHIEEICRTSFSLAKSLKISLYLSYKLHTQVNFAISFKEKKNCLISFQNQELLLIVYCRAYCTIILTVNQTPTSN